MRVHALAKEYGIKSTEFVDIIQGFGVGIKSHLSVIDDGQVADIRQKMENRDRILNEYSTEETIVDETKLELTESDLDEESFDEYDDGEESVVEEVQEYQYQEVEVEIPKGFWGWIKSLFT